MSDVLTGTGPQRPHAARILIRFLAERDAATAAHCDRVATLARQVADALSCSPSRADDVYWVGKLHDLGKIAWPDSILFGKRSLDQADWRLVHRHPAVGAEIVAQIAPLAALAPGIRGHHERLDGSGYPFGLADHQIGLEARIVAVADAFDAMVSERPYGVPLGLDAAAARMRRSAGTEFDPDAVDALLGIVGRSLSCKSTAPHRIPLPASA